jgi:hypothetical protein
MPRSSPCPLRSRRLIAGDDPELEALTGLDEGPMRRRGGLHRALTDDFSRRRRSYLRRPREGATTVPSVEPEPPSSATCALDIRVDGLLPAHAVPRLCEQLVILVDCAGVGRLNVDLGWVSRPDLVTLDALARLALAARQHQAQVRVRTSNGALESLLELAGLGALADPDRSVVEGQG